MALNFTIHPLINGAEMKSMISTSLDVRRRFNSIKISTASCRDPVIKDKKTFLDCIKAVSSECEVILLIGENPTIIDSKYPDVATKLKELLIHYNVLLFYHPSVHAKQLLVDEKEQKIIYISTSNFSRKGLYGNYEVGVVIFINDYDEDEDYLFKPYHEKFIKVFSQYSPYPVFVNQYGQLDWV